MFPRRRTSTREAQMDEVYEHEENAQFRQQVEFLTKQMAVLQDSNQNPSSTFMENDSYGNFFFVTLPLN